VIEGTSGVIQSPGYPNGYPHRHICRWDIVGPPGRSVKVVFEGKLFKEIIPGANENCTVSVHLIGPTIYILKLSKRHYLLKFHYLTIFVSFCNL
jgi:hypothetical protein